MSKPIRHAISSARKFGGTPELYLPLHDFMDSSKGAFSDNRHRLLTHNSWFIQPDGPLERIFGKYFSVPKEDTNEYDWNDIEGEIQYHEKQIQKLREEKARIGRVVVTRDIGEQHCIEDYHSFIPIPSDFLSEMQYKEWMEGKGYPPSHPNYGKEKKIRVLNLD